MSLEVRSSWSGASDPCVALDEIIAEVRPNDGSVLFLYCPSRIDLDALAGAISTKVTVPVLACTAAGEIVPEHGYCTEGIAGMVLDSDDLTVRLAPIPDLRHFGSSDATALLESIEPETSLETLRRRTAFGVLLIDGLSRREEFVVAALHAALGVPLVGGSAGDDLTFERTHVFIDGKFRSNAGVLALFETSLPFSTFKIQSFEPEPHRLVVTRAMPADRRIVDLNGERAATLYARSLGLTEEDLDNEIYLTHPLLMRIGNEYFVRAVNGHLADGSLTLHCAVESGAILRLGRASDVCSGFEEGLRQIRRTIPEPKILLGFDCIDRRMQTCYQKREDSMQEILRRAGLFAFSSYGEQLNGVHLNQTLTGVALGAGPA